VSTGRVLSWISQALIISGSKEAKAIGGLKTYDYTKEHNVCRNIVSIKLRELLTKLRLENFRV